MARLSEKVGLSPSPCWRRVDRLEKEGVITRRVALVDRQKVGLNAHIFAQVKLNAHGRANLDEFAAAIRSFPEVLEAYVLRSEEHTSELQSLMRISYAVFCLKKKN